MNGYPFQWSFLLEGSVIQRLLSGLSVTIELAALGLVIAFVISLPLAFMRLSRVTLMRRVSGGFVDFVRCTPPLVHVLFWYFGASYMFPAPLMNWLLDHNLKFLTTGLALGIYTSVFLAEIFRAGIQAVPEGQSEAGRSIGLTDRQVNRYIVLPQVIRITAPPVINQVLSLIKNTSLGIAVGVTELTFQGTYLQEYTFHVVEAYVGVTVLYLVISLVMTLLYNVTTRRLQLAY